MRVALFDYELPADRIASEPAKERDGARMMVVGGFSASQPSLREDPAAPVGDDAGVRHALVRDLPSLIEPGSVVVVNDTRVIPARLGFAKPSGGRVEVFLIEQIAAASAMEATWRCLVRASKKTRADVELREPSGKLSAYVLGRSGGELADGADDGSLFEVKLVSHGMSLVEAIEACGHTPLPPYIKRADTEADRERYQTIFANERGAVAAPTAGLHLSQRIVDALVAREVRIVRVTLHVSLGTFKPVVVDDFDKHPMHAEMFEVSESTRDAIADARARGAKVVAIGTTSVRALESAADPERPGHVVAKRGQTRLLIQPGYAFRVVDVLFTNFHLPQSTLLALVCAFGGRQKILASYQAAIDNGYRFYSYGDAMLVERNTP